MHTYNPSICKAEVGEVWGQPGLHGQFLANPDKSEIPSEKGVEEERGEGRVSTQELVHEIHNSIAHDDLKWEQLTRSALW